MRSQIGARRSEHPTTTHKEHTMPILVIAGRGRRATLNITGWSPTEIQGAILAAEIDGYHAHTGYGKKEN